MSNGYYVYVFYCEEWREIFYVGKGIRNRYKTLKDRNSQIRAIWDKHKCSSQIIFHDLSENEAIKIEKQLKITLKDNGCPIIDGEIAGCSEKQREGIERAKAEGKYIGRKKIEIDDITFYKQWERYSARELTKTELAKVLKVSRTTLYKILAEKGIAI